MQNTDNRKRSAKNRTLFSSIRELVSPETRRTLERIWADRFVSERNSRAYRETANAKAV